MKITWLGQAGLLFETSGMCIVVDPYLSDHVKTVEPANYRRVPVDELFLRLKPDVIVVTHDHLDHLDKETLKYYFTENAAPLVLAPNGSWQSLRTTFGGKSNYVLFNEGTTWTERNVAFRAVRAEHSDPYAIGLWLYAEGKQYYVTGDTLYSERVFASLPNASPDVLFLPINGKGNNMNFTDAASFASRIGARYTVPLHFGLFDEMKGEELVCENRVIPRIYEEIPLID